MNLKVLIVDDEAELRKSVASVLQMPDLPFTVEIDEAEDGEQAVKKVETQTFDLVLMDVRMPNMDGLTALELIRKNDPRTFVVIITAHANLKDAIQAIKFGAYDYLEKPVQPEKLRNIVEKVLETREMVSELAISSPVLDDDVDTEFIGSSQKMRQVFDLIYRLSHVDTTVLIRGENGTGKELVARAIHYNSPRKHGDFVPINCGAIPENLLESEFFGYEKGAFTGAVSRKIGQFQVANKGTLFLDEIAELRPELQVKLLRVLQDRKFIPVGGTREIRSDARVVAATNRNLEKMIDDGSFREDLFYRLNVMPIFLPPLRERIDDLPDLVSFFLKKYSKRHNRTIREIAPDAMEIMRQYRWPGNIRELENAIERAFVVSNGDIIKLEMLPESIVRASKSQVEIKLPQNYVGPLDYDRFKEEAEKEFIVRALRSNHGKINKTVAQASIPKNTLLRKIKKYGIDVRAIVEESGH